NPFMNLPLLTCVSCSIVFLSLLRLLLLKRKGQSKISSALSSLVSCGFLFYFPTEKLPAAMYLQIFIRIYSHAVLLYLEMQVRSGRLPGTSDISDLLAFFHMLSRRHAERTVMHIFCRQTVSVIDDYPVARTRAVSGDRHGAGCCRISRRPGWSR